MPNGIPIYIDDRQIPAFHPIRHREDGAWYPTNEAASLLVHIGHIWDDILTLDCIMRERQNETEKKLLFKYIIIELYSVLDPLARLQTIVMTAPEREKGQTPPQRSVTPKEKEQAKTLLKAHNVARNQIESEVSNIRNSIGAHRRLQPWDEVISLWDRLEPDGFIELLNTIPPIYNFIKKLDLYDWSRTTEEGHTQMLVARFYPEDFVKPGENPVEGQNAA